MLTIIRKTGEDITVTIFTLLGSSQIKVTIDAPLKVQILRTELVEKEIYALS